MNWQPQTLCETFQIAAKCIIGTLRKSQPSHQLLLMNTCTLMSICIILFVYVLYNLVIGINSANSSVVHDVRQCLWALLCFPSNTVPVLIGCFGNIIWKREEEIFSKIPWHMIWHALCVFGTTCSRLSDFNWIKSEPFIHSLSQLFMMREKGRDKEKELDNMCFVRYCGGG